EVRICEDKNRMLMVVRICRGPRKMDRGQEARRKRAKARHTGQCDRAGHTQGNATGQGTGQSDRGHQHKAKRQGLKHRAAGVAQGNAMGQSDRAQAQGRRRRGCKA
ncbi:hypothetical protein CLAIMM_12139, partial [Cladophialophora immunda]